MITLGKVSTRQAGLIKQRCQALRTGSSQSMPCSIRLGPPSPLTLAAYPGTVITEQSTMLNSLSLTVGRVATQVFCTKRSPNCTACPLRHDCDYALANGQHLQPGLVRPKKATPRPRKPASRANAILALPSADNASATGAASDTSACHSSKLPQSTTIVSTHIPTRPEQRHTHAFVRHASLPLQHADKACVLCSAKGLLMCTFLSQDASGSPALSTYKLSDR